MTGKGNNRTTSLIDVLTIKLQDVNVVTLQCDHVIPCSIKKCAHCSEMKEGRPKVTTPKIDQINPIKYPHNGSIITIKCEVNPPPPWKRHCEDYCHAPILRGSKIEDTLGEDNMVIWTSNTQV